MDEIDNKALEAVAWDCTQWPKWLRDVVDQTNETADRLDMSSEQAHAFAALLTRASKLAALEDESKTLREAVELFQSYGCPVCGGDCGSANPPVIGCPMQTAHAALSKPAALPAEGNGESEDYHRPVGYFTDEKGPCFSAILNLFHRHKCSEPPARLRDELSSMLAWARYGRDRKAATPPAPQPLEGAVKVKELEWQPTTSGYGVEANTIIGNYWVRDGQFWAPGCTVSHPYRTDADAQEGAQKHFNRRILSSLSPAPQPVGEVRAKDLCWTSMPSYGEVQFQQLVEAVAQAIYADRHFAWPPRDIDQTRFIGHQIVPTINFNSLNRIVSAFVRATLSASPSPAAQEDGE